MTIETRPKKHGTSSAAVDGEVVASVDGGVKDPKTTTPCGGSAEDPNTKKVVKTFDKAEDVNVDTFLKSALKEMLVADTDTMHLVAEVKNPDGTKININFDLVITSLTQEE